VAQLAGLPQLALQSAQETLASLESNQETVAAINTCAPLATQNTAMPAATPQLDMFKEPNAIQNYITKLKLDDISPREALQHLYALSELNESSI